MNEQDGVNKQICVSENSESSKVIDPLNSKEFLSNVATVASLLKYDYQIAKSHFSQQLRQLGMFTIYIFLNNFSF